MAVVYNPFTESLQFLNSASGGMTVVTSDPSSPAVDDIWLLKQDRAGQAMGVLGLTYTDTVYLLSVKGATGIFRVRLT